MLRTAYACGAQDALVKLGLALPSPRRIGNTARGPRTLSKVNPPSFEPLSLNAVPTDLGRAAKVGATVGLAARGPVPEGAGAVRGEPADVGRRQRSVIDRAFQRNDDDFATSAMPLPGAQVQP